MPKSKSKKSRLRVAILGSTGRMGSILREMLLTDERIRSKFELCFICSGPRDENFLQFPSARADVVIDFSAPSCSLAFLKEYAHLKTPYVLCTTGFSEKENSALQKLLKNTAWTQVPNTSLGIFMLKRALGAVLPLLPASFSVHIVESHHLMKKDAPSGTALMLQKAIQELSPGRDVDMHSIRAGNIVGEHVIKLIGPSETLTFSHNAENRALFAEGSLSIAEKIVGKKVRPKPYSLEELF